MSQGDKQRTPKAKTPGLQDEPLHPNVDAVLWILARHVARKMLEPLISGSTIPVISR